MDATEGSGMRTVYPSASLRPPGISPSPTLRRMTETRKAQLYPLGLREGRCDQTQHRCLIERETNSRRFLPMAKQGLTNAISDRFCPILVEGIPAPAMFVPIEGGFQRKSDQS